MLKVKINSEKMDTKARRDKCLAVEREMEKVINSEAFKAEVLKMPRMKGELSYLKELNNREIFEYLMVGKEWYNEEDNHTLDVFIDDLEEIFLHDNFPEIKKILFSGSSSIRSGVELCNNWTDIENASIGEIENSEIKHLVNSIYDEPIKSVEKLKGRGNSRIYKLSLNKKNSILLKDYPDLSVDSSGGPAHLCQSTVCQEKWCFIGTIR